MTKIRPQKQTLDLGKKKKSVFFSGQFSHPVSDFFFFFFFFFFPFFFFFLGAQTDYKQNNIHYFGIFLISVKSTNFANFPIRQIFDIPKLGKNQKPKKKKKKKKNLTQGNFFFYLF